MMVVVGTPVANIVLIGRDTTATRKSIREKATISDEASPARTSVIILTNASTTESRTKTSAVSNMMLYTALLG